MSARTKKRSVALATTSASTIAYLDKFYSKRALIECVCALVALAEGSADTPPGVAAVESYCAQVLTARGDYAPSRMAVAACICRAEDAAS